MVRGLPRLRIHPPTQLAAAVRATTGQDTHTVAINTIRGLCMDAIQMANSGLPGDGGADPALPGSQE